MESNFAINQILLRYNSSPEKNLKYAYEELKSINIDLEFIYTLLRTFEDEKTFSQNEYKKFPVEVIIDYIRRTHRYYLAKKLCEIEQSISILLKDYSGSHPLLHILNNFFFDYKNGLAAHIHAEETYLLPYIHSLLLFEQGKLSIPEYFVTTKNYSVQAFIEAHHDTEQDLSNVRSAILEYHPPKTNQTPYRILITQLKEFEKDLSVHALIEDRVLIPRTLELEKECNEAFYQKIKMN
ncbi:hypothetical protein BH11BAC1_BH11BAC1_17290 [soil metagenome]